MLLELLGELARKHYPAPGEVLVQLVQQLLNAVGGLVEHKSAANGLKALQFSAPLPLLVGQETEEMKLLGRQSAGRQRGHQRAWPRHRLDAQGRRDRRVDHPLARIADAWAAGIGHQRDLLPAPQSLDDLLATPGLIELEVAQQRLGDAEMLQQLPCPARILRRHHVAFLERAQRTLKECDVVAAED